MANNSKTKPTQAQQPQRTFLISSAVLMDVMRYLMTRPYGEVVKLMGAFFFGATSSHHLPVSYPQN